MKLLLTSAGISNQSIHNALLELLGKPIEECNALCIPTAIYACRGGAAGAYRFVSGTAKTPLVGLGWQSLGVLELTALPSVDRENWIPAVEEADALLVYGGDVLYLRHWMRASGLAELYNSLGNRLVYVGISAGSMVMTSYIGETIIGQQPAPEDDLTSELTVIDTPDGELGVHFTVSPGMGLVDLALLAHAGHESFPENSFHQCELWATKLPVPLYALDDQSAIKVIDGVPEVVSEGEWRLFQPNLKPHQD